ncbi:APOBEC1 complementation factor isoform X6 [Scyliorhinus canicula]|uniref:APOBEC1 complementation factor isoform X6 n=1 Tax=Scyliorhinus canicula TaxID=7830 RepID=UPI0018F34BFB|nr:APOBEC1 complementation factor isoform X6 [Scyliorhinus canicula]
MESNQKNGDGLTGTQKEATLRALIQRTGYSLVQENGQRKYGGPPPEWEGPTPERGCEIFIGKLPRDLYEDELVPVLEKIGKIYELRMMMDFNGNNRGYAFVLFTSRQDAKNAIKQLNNYEIRNGRLLGVCASVDNCRLFVGGIPKTKRRDEILAEMKKVTEGVVDVIVYPSAADKTKNRGFAFVEYDSHRAAAMARRKLLPGRIQLWGHPIAVDWAEPEVEVDEETMSSVKILYVRNLMLPTSEEAIEKEFNSIKPGIVERVKKIRDYAFVHFVTREDAINAMNRMNGKVLDGSPIEVTLAKPVDKDSYVRYTRGTGGRGALLQGEYTYTLGQVYDPAAAYLGAPVFYAPQAYAAIPNLRFPNKGHLSARGMIRAPSVRGYHVKTDKRQEEKLYDLLPGMELTPTNPVTLKPQGMKHSSQILEDICQKNSWGQPVYQLHSAIGPDQRQLFVYKITIPALANQYTNIQPFTPPKLCTAVEEAKSYAAEHVLQILGLQTEGAEPPAAAAFTGRPLSMPVSYLASSTDLPFPCYATGYALAGAAATVAATQLKQAVALGQDLATYATYEGYPAFAVPTRGDTYGAF